MRLRRSVATRTVAVSAVLVSLFLLAVPQPLMAATRKLPLAVVAQDYRFLGVPSTLPAGTYDTRFLNLGDEFHVMVALNLGPVCSNFSDGSILRLIDEVGSTEDPEAAFGAACPGGNLAGDPAAPPGGRDRQDVTLTPGRAYYFCPVPTEDGVPHYKLGMDGFVNVRSVPSFPR